MSTVSAVGQQRVRAALTDRLTSECAGHDDTMQAMTPEHRRWRDGGAPAVHEHQP